MRLTWKVIVAAMATSCGMGMVAPSQAGPRPQDPDFRIITEIKSGQECPAALPALLRATRRSNFARLPVNERGRILGLATFCARSAKDYPVAYDLAVRATRVAGAPLYVWAAATEDRLRTKAASGRGRNVRADGGASAGIVERTTYPLHSRSLPRCQEGSAPAAPAIGRAYRTQFRASRTGGNGGPVQGRAGADPRCGRGHRGRSRARGADHDPRTADQSDFRATASPR